MFMPFKHAQNVKIRTVFLKKKNRTQTFFGKGKKNGITEKYDQNLNSEKKEKQKK